MIRVWSMGAARGGYGLDAHWADDFHHAVHRFFTGEHTGYYADFDGLADIATALAHGYVYQGQYSKFRQRRHGRMPHGVSSDQLVIFAQNHDQIGNRARGERLSMLLPPQELKAIAALTLLSPFVPLLFQGEEWGASTPFLYFTDHQDLELGRLGAEGRSREFNAFAWTGEVPDPQARDTFEQSKLDWAEAGRPEHAELLLWYRRLIDLRRTRTRPSRTAKPRIKFDAAAKWFRFTLGDTLAMFNFAAHAQPVPLPAGDWDMILSSEAADTGTMSEMPARGTRVFRVRPSEV